MDFRSGPAREDRSGDGLPSWAKANAFERVASRGVRGAGEYGQFLGEQDVGGGVRDLRLPIT